MSNTKLAASRYKPRSPPPQSMSEKCVAEYLICHHAESKCLTGPYAGKPTSSFTGACYFKGSIDGSEEGEVVFWTTKGSFGSVLEAEWTIDEKTTLGGLKGLKGHGGYRHEIKEG
ncbi:hypothetical protein FRC12_015829 [Ceratobasidium sp. 428]|nr:hypothetical protein FRC12_015829 [Ceratobasidium sp. 428]